MQDFPPDAMSRTHGQERPFRFPDRAASSDSQPPAPLQMFTRLVVLLAIALGFGLAAQLLVGMVH